MLIFFGHNFTYALTTMQSYEFFPALAYIKVEQTEIITFI